MPLGTLIQTTASKERELWSCKKEETVFFNLSHRNGNCGHVVEAHEAYCRLQSYKAGASSLDNRDINVLKTKGKKPTKYDWKKRKHKSFRKWNSPWSTHVLGMCCTPA